MKCRLNGCENNFYCNHEIGLCKFHYQQYYYGYIDFEGKKIPAEFREKAIKDTKKLIYKKIKISHNDYIKIYEMRKAGMSFGAIAKKYNVSRQRIHQLF